MYSTEDKSKSPQIHKDNSNEAILWVNRLKKFFPIHGGIWRRVIGYVYAVNDVSFTINRGETIGIVGESGCGKTTLGRAIMALTPVTDGEITFQEFKISRYKNPAEEKAWRRNNFVIGMVSLLVGFLSLIYGISIIAIRSREIFDFELLAKIPIMVLIAIIVFPILGGYLLLKGLNKLSTLSPRQLELRKKIQMVFQDPYASLNPRMTVRATLSEPLKVHKILPKDEIDKHLIDLLETVGLGSMHLDRFPHEFSGGQRQRIVIARALVLQPELVVLDEPTASTDVSVQAKILNLLKDIQKQKGLTYIFISHDLSVIKHMSDRIIVMYLGKAVEIGTKEMFSDPENIHPYTRALFSAVPVADPKFRKKKIIISGDVPSSSNPPPGCVFHTRCPYYFSFKKSLSICVNEEPEMLEVEKGHFIACNLYKEPYKFDIASIS